MDKVHFCCSLLCNFLVYRDIQRATVSDDEALRVARVLIQLAKSRSSFFSDSEAVSDRMKSKFSRRPEDSFIFKHMPVSCSGNAEQWRKMTVSPFVYIPK